MMLASAILSIVAVISPIPVSYEILKDFQPLIAALVALTAATLAYRGAMAKVGLDREANERDRYARRVGLYLRLRSQLKRLQSEAKRILRLSDVKGASEFPTSFSEVENAWLNLELLPDATFDLMEELRLCISRFKDLNDKHLLDPKIVPTAFVAALYYQEFNNFMENSTSLIRALDTAIEDLKRFD
jgi:hypothetical protein